MVVGTSFVLLAEIEIQDGDGYEKEQEAQDGQGTGTIRCEVSPNLVAYVVPIPRGDRCRRRGFRGNGVHIPRWQRRQPRSGKRSHGLGIILFGTVATALAGIFSLVAVANKEVSVFHGDAISVSCRINL